jgi:two-component system NtrC family sensor kinase
LNDNDELEYILIRISDITERKIYESHLIQSEKMSSLGILVSSIAHEINNPNSFISFNIPILREYIEGLIPIIDRYVDEHPDFELCNMQYTDFRKDLATILDNVEHGSIRINDFISYLKDYTQLQDSVKEEWIDLNKVIDNAISIVSAKLIQSVKQFNLIIPCSSLQGNHLFPLPWWERVRVRGIKRYPHL